MKGKMAGNENNERDTSSISDNLWIAMQDVEEAILAVESMLVEGGADDEVQTRANAILACVLTKFSELRKSFDQYVRRVEFDGRLPFNPECEALIQANPARLLPQQMDWFRRFHYEHPEAARQFIEGAPVVGRSATQGGAELDNSRERQSYAAQIILRASELPTPALKALAAHLWLPLPQAPKPVRAGRRPGRGTTGRKLREKRAVRTRA